MWLFPGRVRATATTYQDLQGRATAKRIVFHRRRSSLRRWSMRLYALRLPTTLALESPAAARAPKDRVGLDSNSERLCRNAIDQRARSSLRVEDNACMPLP